MELNLIPKDVYVEDIEINKEFVRFIGALLFKSSK